MTELLTAAQMRAIEQEAIESGAVTGLELMERAGRGVVEAIFEHWPELAKTSHRAVILCGPGKNGGDGFVVARLLVQWGWEVQVFLFGSPEKLPTDALTNYTRWIKMGEVTPLSEKAFRAPHPIQERAYADVYVDALFGTGLTKPIGDDVKDVLTHMTGRNGDDYTPYTVAIDAPSGLCLDSGRVLGAAISDAGDYRGKAAAAALTVAFDSPKVGHFIGLGPTLCGKLVIKDIGLEDWRITQPLGQEETPALMGRGGAGRALRPIRTKVICETPLVKDARSFLGLPPKVAVTKSRFAAHKYNFGHALVLSGGAGKTGAARLAARGALRIGAGLVTLGVPVDARAEVAAQITALMMKTVDDETDLSNVLSDPRINSVCMGPGLGISRARKLTEVVLKAEAPRATVLDADAVTAYEDSPDALFDLLHEECILTPHLGEFRRLFPDICEKLEEPKPPVVQYVSDFDLGVLNQQRTEILAWHETLRAQTGPAFSKIDAVRIAAERAGCIILLKGPDTVIGGPNGQCAVHSAEYDRAAPWLATAGSGDVLAGFITGLLARGCAPMAAAETAAWLHVECARSFGPGLIAEDLPEQLPTVFGQIGL